MLIICQNRYKVAKYKYYKESDFCNYYKRNVHLFYHLNIQLF